MRSPRLRLRFLALSGFLLLGFALGWPPTPSHAAPANPQGPGRFTVTLFTSPERPQFNEKERAFIAALKAAGFTNVKEQPGGEGDGAALVAIAKGQEATGKIVQELARRHFGSRFGDFALRAEFDSEDTDLFVNLGPYASAGQAPPRSPASFKVTVYTEVGRDVFTPREEALLAALRAAGFTNIVAEPGPGGTNEEANVKVARGQEEVGLALQGVLRTALGPAAGDFVLRSEWEPDDGDIFINLGPHAEKTVVQLGQQAPELAGLEWLDGRPVSLAEGRDKSFYLVEFWATWCGPCEQTMPELSKLQEKHAGQGLVIVGVTDESADKVRDFLKTHKTPAYRLASDPSRTARMAYMTGIDSIPHAFLVDRAGRIVWQGHPSSAGPVVERLLAGTFDLQEALRQDGVRKAFAEAAEGDDAEAIRKLALQVLDFDPTSEEALEAALAALRTGSDPKPYWDFVRRQMERTWNNPEALVNLAVGMITQDDGFTDLGLAHRAALRAVELTKDKDARTLLVLARILYEGGFPAEAAGVLARSASAEADEETRAKIDEVLKYYRRCEVFHREHGKAGGR